MRHRYTIDQSPLYNIQTKRNLAEVLQLSWEEFLELKKSGDKNYTFFDKSIEKNGKTKTRHIERPKRRLRQVQKRIANLLDRIQPPEYIHSGFKKVSYLSNALSHECGVPVAKIDIKAFFPNARAPYVYSCFNAAFKCSPDVSGVLAAFTTVFEHLPTGGNSSSIISFYAYRPMFDEVYELSNASGLKMTCCVDDMTFSGEKATKGFLFKVSQIAYRYGLKTHKVHCFKPRQPKIVTGIALTTNGYRLPNSRRLLLHKAINKFKEESDIENKKKIGQELLGRVANAAEVEKQFKPLLAEVKTWLGYK